jgi:hypothetical protein
MTRGRWHLERPAVYLDHWVWVSLARAAKGRPEQPSHAVLLDACRQAAVDGVAFPLSSTHYLELHKTNNERQRFEVAAVMAQLSNCRTLRLRGDLVRHQMRTAFHELFGRPAFRPAPQDVLGRGAAWAFTGAHLPLRIYGPDGVIGESELPGISQTLRAANQYAEFLLLAGPRDNEVEQLRQRGYRPESVAESSASRVEFERFLTGSLAENPVSANELRVYVAARELVHEYFDIFTDLIAEYRINLRRDLGFDDDVPGSGRGKLMALGEAIPTLKIAVDLKYGLFRDTTRTWSLNHVSDVDAVAEATPYCRVVVTDADVAARARQTNAAAQLGTIITASIDELLDLLPALATEARYLGGDATGWDEVGPGVGFNIEMPQPLAAKAASCG